MDIYEQLYQAFTAPTIQPARRTFGKVEYAFIPVSVIEAILNHELYDFEEELSDADDAATTDPPTSLVPEDTILILSGTTEFPDDEADGEVAADSGEEEE